MADGSAAGRLQEKSKNTAEEMEEEDEDEDYFEVEQIIGKSKVKGVVSYKVRWKGYGSEEDTWEPEDNLDSCRELIDEYNEKREESLKQKAEERKMRQALMEGRISSPESSEENQNSPYPPNFKNSFWKDLEAGRIDVFDSNMYSKVKERTVKLQSLKEFKQSKVQESESGKKNSEETKKRVVKESDLTQSKSCKRSPSVSQKCSTPAASSKSRNQSSSKSKKKPMSNNDTFCVQSDSESESNYKCCPVIQEKRKEELSHPDTGQESNKRPGIKLIMKLPKPPGDKDGTIMVTTKHLECKDLYKHQTPSPERNQENTKKKKPKHNKHSDHKSKDTEHKKSSFVEKQKQNADENFISNETGRKRKISETLETGTCASVVVEKKSVAIDRFNSTVKTPGEGNNSKVETTVVKKGCDLNIIEDEPAIKQEITNNTEDCALNSKTDLLPKDLESHNPPIAVEYSGLNWDFPHNSVTKEICDSNQTLGVSAIKIEPSFDIDLSPTGRSHVTLNSNTISTLSYNNMASTFHNKDPMMPSTCLDPINNTTLSHNTSSNFHNSSPILPNMCINPINNTTSHNMSHNTSHNTSHNFLQTGFEYHTNNTSVIRRDSDTVDSGIASPASEKSLGLSRSESTNPFEDVLSQSILPFLPESDRLPEKEADHEFDINLDEIDWEMFDREVKLEPITLSHEEFVKAVMTGDYELVKRAFMGDGKYNIEYTDQSGRTLLMHASQHGYDDIADLLIEHGANINAQMASGITPLMTACQFAELCTVNLLIELGAKVNLQAYNGESALMLAVRRGHKHITWLLLECGANFSLKSHAGYTALSYARAFNHFDTESVITSHVDRVMSEFQRQVSVTLNNLANIREMVFPPQVFNISEEEMFHVNFNYTSQLPPIHGLGYLLFLGHAVFTSEEVKCRFYGPCAVKAACLNGVPLSPLTQEGNFVLAFNPVRPGMNTLSVNTVKETDMKGKLIVCAYKAQLV